MSDAFISYSRKDSDFARRLVNALDATGRESWVDWEGIPYSADWWREICAGIDSGETFILIISPDSLTSMVCNQEVIHARQNNKRIIPLMHRDIDEKQIAGEWFDKDWEPIARQNWTELKKLNWLFFRESDDFDRAFASLIETVEQDPEHVRFHTRLLVRAREWKDSSQQDTGLLLRGNDLREAENWLTFSANNSPQPTALHIEYIRASMSEHEHEEAAERRQRDRLRVLVVVLSVLLVIAAIAAGIAVNRTQVAQAESNERATQQHIAENNAGTATHALGQVEIRSTDVAREAATSQANLLQAWNNQSHFLADLSRQALEAEHPHDALLLALESLAHFPTIAPFEGRQALMNALTNPIQEIASLQHDGLVSGAEWSGDGRRILSWSGQDGTVRVWDLDQPDNPLIFRPEDVKGARWSVDPRYVFSWSNQNTIYRWDLQQPDQPLILRAPEYTDTYSWSADDQLILVKSVDWRGGDGTAYVWRLDEPDKLIRLEHGLVSVFYRPYYDTNLLDASWSADGQRIFTTARDGAIRVWDLEAPDNPLIFRPLGIELQQAVWSADGQSILSWASEEGVVYLWRLDKPGEPLIWQVSVPLTLVQWSSDEQFVLAWTQDDTLGIWMPDRADPARFLPGGDSPRYFSWNPQGRRLLTWNLSGDRLRLWDLDALDATRVLPHRDVIGATWRPDGKFILSWSDDGTLHLWDTASLDSPVRTLLHPGLERASIRWSVDGNWIESVNASVEIQLWNMNDLDNPLTLPVSGFRLAPYGRSMLSSAGNTVRVWTFEEATGVQRTLWDDYVVRGVIWAGGEQPDFVWTEVGQVRVEGHGAVDLQDELLSAAWLPDEQKVIASSANGAVYVWDSKTGQVSILEHARHTGSSHSGSLLVVGVIWRADDRHLVSWSRDGSVLEWDLQQPDQPVVLLSGLLDPTLSWSADKQRFLAYIPGALENTIQVFDLDNRNVPMTLTHRGSVLGAFWSASGGGILSWTDAGEVYLWDLNHLESPLLLSCPFPIQGVKWSADEQRILTWSQAGTVQIRDLNHPDTPVLTRHFGHSMLEVTWSSGEGKLLSWAGDNRVFVWDLDDPQDEPRFYIQHQGGIIVALWSADEQRVLSWSVDGAMYVTQVNLETGLAPKIGQEGLSNILKQKEHGFLSIFGHLGERF